MGDLIGHLTDAPIPNLLVLAGLVFVAIAVLGNITAKINPSKNGRIASGVVGAALIAGGLMFHAASDTTRAPATPPVGTAAVATQPAAAGTASNAAAPAAASAAETQPATAGGAAPAAGSLDGTWLAQKAHGKAINRIVIRQQGGQALVHAWMNCTQPACDLGEQPATLANGAADVQFVSGAVGRSVTITPISASQVRVVVHYIDASHKVNRNFDWTFVRSQ